ncbi:hypothetical protein DC498_18740 [Terrimonas sp.]|uniref:hypothetical protein n=1 Tax=Terrimonas sp. TaxID=1914338 RepID=UPI000D521F44|nr:hypothetical protein [Terrimonas sp.]PVD50633.1 hypothetical protein DC498_18740 [Terrimonas sp.]
MQPKIFITLLLFCTATFATHAQDKNPYKELGKKGEILTLTKGQFNEFFDEGDVQQIGTNLVNIRTMKVVKVMTEDEAEKRLDNTTGKRFLSVDPIAGKYPMLTPYQYASNSPIAAIDLDGLEGFITMPNEQGNKLYNANADVIKTKVFKSTFSHYLPKKFIDLYSNGQGTPYRLSQKETQDLHVAYTGFHGITENDNAKATDFINSIKPGESMELPEGYSITGAAMNAGTLGRFQIRLRGKVTKDKDDNFSFEGQMQYYDIYDFKTTKTKEGDLQRNDWGDMQTDFADKNLNGKGFEITSEWIDIKQENSNYFDYFKGKSEEVIMNKMADKSKVTGEVKKANSENKQ